MRRYLVISLMLLSLSPSVSKAESLLKIIGNGGAVGDWLGDAVYQLQIPSSKDIQGSRFFYGGGFYLRTPRKTYQLFNFQPPRISAGCGGIDLTFGAYSYLNPKYLVEFGKQVLSHAPAFAFKTAIEVFCPTCEDIMTKLENLANLMNSLQLDSCAAAQALFDYAGSKLKSAIASKESASGRSDSYLDKLNSYADRARDLLKEYVNKGLESSETMRIVSNLANQGMTDISLVDDVMVRLAQNNKPGGTELVKDSQWREVAKTLFGDLKIIVPGSDDEDLSLKFEPPYAMPKNLGKALEDLFFSGETVVGGKDLTFRPYGGKSVYERAKEVTDSIANKITTRTALSSDELEFLAMFPFPAYRLLNNLSVYPGILQQVSDDLARYFTLELAKFVVLEYIRAYTHALTDLLKAESIPTEQKQSEIRWGALNFIGAVNIASAIGHMEKAKQSFVEKIKSNLELINTVERETARMLSGDPVYSAVMWQNSLGVKFR